MRTTPTYGHNETGGIGRGSTRAVSRAHKRRTSVGTRCATEELRADRLRGRLSGEHGRAVSRALGRKTALGRANALRRVELGERVHEQRARGASDATIAGTLGINGDARSREPQALRKRLNRLERAAGLSPVPIDDKARQAVAKAQTRLTAAAQELDEARAKLGLGPELLADDVLNAHCESLAVLNAELRYWKCLRELREKALAANLRIPESSPPEPLSWAQLDARIERLAREPLVRRFMADFLGQQDRFLEWLAGHPKIQFSDAELQRKRLTSERGPDGWRDRRVDRRPILQWLRELPTEELRALTTRLQWLPTRQSLDMLTDNGTTSEAAGDSDTPREKAGCGRRKHQPWWERDLPRYKALGEVPSELCKHCGLPHRERIEFQRGAKQRLPIITARCLRHRESYTPGEGWSTVDEAAANTSKRRLSVKCPPNHGFVSNR